MNKTEVPILALVARFVATISALTAYGLTVAGFPSPMLLTIVAALMLALIVSELTRFRGDTNGRGWVVIIGCALMAAASGLEEDPASGRVGMALALLGLGLCLGVVGVWIRELEDAPAPTITPPTEGGAYFGQ